jgi:hypothetical protein
MTGLDPTAAVTPTPISGSVSAVIVVDDLVPDRIVVHSWGDALAEFFADIELVIVANGVSSAIALELEALTAVIPDLTVHFLAERIDRDTARLVGLDTAIGDWILLAEPRVERLPVLQALVERLHEGYQVGIALGEEVNDRSRAYIWLSSVYFRLYYALTGREVLSPAPALRIYSRAAGLYLAGSAEGEMLLKTSTVASGFPVFLERRPGLAPDRPPARTWRQTVAKGLQELLSATSAPLRLASAIAVASGVLSLFYMVYVVAVYLFKPGVEGGWTTLSLQISGMMFLFSLLFALMAEYMLGIYRGLLPRRRYVITREVRSIARRHSRRLNVINEGGDFHLGMPPQIAAQELSR